MVGDEFIAQANEHEQNMAALKAEERSARREFWLTILTGLAVVTVILGVVGAIAFWAVNNGRQGAEKINACTASGGSWVELNQADTCLHLDGTKDA